METRSSKVCFSNILLEKTAEKFLVPPLWEKIRTCLFPPPPPNGCRRRFFFSCCKLSTRWQKPARPTIDARSRHRLSRRSTRSVSAKANQCRWRPRRHHHVDPWSRGREHAGGVLPYPSKPEKNFVLPLLFEMHGEVFSSVLCNKRPNVF